MAGHPRRSKSRTPELVSHVGDFAGATAEPITDLSEAAAQIAALLERVRKEGRRVLVVIGAGCSYAVRKPNDSAITSTLRFPTNSTSGFGSTRLRQCIPSARNSSPNTSRRIPSPTSTNNP